MQPLVLTLGEPAGIGPDCVLLAYAAEPELFDHILVVAPSVWLRQRADELGLAVNIEEVAGIEWQPGSALCCWNPLAESPQAEVGKPSGQTAAAVIGCIEVAARACLAGQAAGMVTAPIEKAVLRNAGFAFPGHTEFLADLCQAPQEVMMLASQHLRVALLTTHVALREVPNLLSREQTSLYLQVLDEALRQQFAIEQPRIGLCALNPHGGEQGHFGREEIDILAPAAAQARAAGVNVDGPLPSDTLFSQAIRDGYDAILCCYHDQALIPIKALSFGETVNVTLGLPIIRTSVDHGTALERAGTGQVSYSSLQEAIRMARSMAANAEARSMGVQVCK